MKARVKATGEIVEVKPCEEWTTMYGEILTYISDDGVHYSRHALSFKIDDERDEQSDYWTRLEHTYTGMAMHGMIKRAYNAYCDDCANYENMIFEDAQALLKDHAEALADVCVEFAHALVEKLKEKEKRK